MFSQMYSVICRYDAMMPTKSRLKHSQQVIATNISLHSPIHQHLKNLRQTNKKTDWSVIREFGRTGDLRDRQHHRSLPLSRKSELTKKLFKIWVSTGKSNFKNDKGIPSTAAASELMDITASQRIQAHHLCGPLQIHQLHSAKISSKK
jgi:hypothetical protein